MPFVNRNLDSHTRRVRDLPELSQLVGVVTGESEARHQSALERIDLAESVVAELHNLGDRLVGYFVEQARAEGHSWADIGAHLGVSRQAAQQRYTPRWSSLTLADLADAGSFTRLTPRTKEALRRAEDHVRRLRHASLRPEHLLLAVLDDPDTFAVKALAADGVDPAGLREALQRLVPAGEEYSPATIPVDAPARRALEAALGQALELGHNYIGTEHLLLGLVADRQSRVGRLLADRGLTLDKVRGSVRALIDAYLQARR
jgi:hypothetical protein